MHNSLVHLTNECSERKYELTIIMAHVITSNEPGHKVVNIDRGNIYVLNDIYIS